MRGPALDSRDTPCHHCTDRYTACSDYCQKPEFIAWKEEQARIKKAREQYRPPVWKREEKAERRVGK
jgi:hypothetical protein